MRKIGLAAVVILALLFGTNSFADDGADKDWSRYRVAIGSGIPYGGDWGAGVELTPIEHLSLSAALGYFREGETGWSLGLRYYPFTIKEVFRPRLSAYYGVVAILKWPNGGHKTDTGSAYGIGLDWKRDLNISFDFDLLYRDYTPPSGFECSRDIFLSVGIGYNF